MVQTSSTLPSSSVLLALLQNYSQWYRLSPHQKYQQCLFPVVLESSYKQFHSPFCFLPFLGRFGCLQILLPVFSKILWCSIAWRFDCSLPYRQQGEAPQQQHKIHNRTQLFETGICQSWQLSTAPNQTSSSFRISCLVAQSIERMYWLHSRCLQPW